MCPFTTMHELVGEIKNNGSGNMDSVSLLINVCPEERMMCYDLNILKDIVAYFCETGLRNPKYNWMEEGF